MASQRDEAFLEVLPSLIHESYVVWHRLAGTTRLPHPSHWVLAGRTRPSSEHNGEKYRNSPFVFIKKTMGQLFPFVYCTSNSHTFWIKETLMKLFGVIRAPIAHLLLLYITKESKNVVRHCKKRFTCIFSNNKITWIKFLHCIQFVGMKSQFFVEDLPQSKQQQHVFEQDGRKTDCPTKSLFCGVIVRRT